MLQSNIRESLKAYRQAMKIDESSVSALTGKAFILAYISIHIYLLKNK